MMKNPYYEEFIDLRRKYSWAIPTHRVLSEIAKLSPIVEWFAGAGYWSWMLEQYGANVTAYSIKPGDQGEGYGYTIPWTNVFELYPNEIVSNCLLMVRPPEKFVKEIINRFTGKYIVRVDTKIPEYFDVYQTYDLPCGNVASFIKYDN